MKMGGRMDSPVAAQFSEEPRPIGSAAIPAQETNPSESGRIAHRSVPALACALVLLLAAGLSAAFAGPIGKPCLPADGNSGRVAARVDRDRPGPFASSHRGPGQGPSGRRIHAPPIGLASSALRAPDPRQGVSEGPGTAFARGARRPARRQPGSPCRCSATARQGPPRGHLGRAAGARQPVGGQTTGAEGPTEANVVRAGCTARRARRRDETAPRNSSVPRVSIRNDSGIDRTGRSVRFAEPNLRNQIRWPREGPPWDDRRRRT